MSQSLTPLHHPAPKTRTLLVRVEKHYGRTTVYPACETSTLFAQLAGHKTLTPKTLSLAIKLGYTLTTTTPSMEDILKELS